MSVDVQVATDAAGIPETGKLREWVEHTIRAAGPGGDFDVSIRIVDAGEMQDLNRDYRDQDKPTNVLAFPAGDTGFAPPGERPLLGDIVVCAGIVADEAGEQGKALGDHWGHMLVHGTLHLLGYDHQTDHEAEAMEAIERDILESVGIADPYAGN